MDIGISQEVTEAAAIEVISNNRSGRSVTEEYGICHASFHWFCIMLSKDKNP
jgi:hypothetical protein